MVSVVPESHDGPMIWWVLGAAILVTVGLVFVIRYGDRLTAEPPTPLHRGGDERSAAGRTAQLHRNRAA